MKIVLEERRDRMNREEYMNYAGDLEYEINSTNEGDCKNCNNSREPGMSVTLNTPLLSIYCC